MARTQDNRWKDSPHLGERLRQLWAEGLSTAAIAKIMCREPDGIGITKNSVVGVARRMGLPQRPKALMNVAGVKRSFANRPKWSYGPQGERAAPTLSNVIAYPTGDPLPIKPSVRVTECCWPIGTPGKSGFRFCGDEVMPGKPYCLEHVKKAYIPKHGDE